MTARPRSGRRSRTGLEIDEVHDVEEPRAVRVSLHLIVKRHLPPEASKWKHDTILEHLEKITHVRLDRENIGCIEGFELLGSHVANLYMQHNRIKVIENLEYLTNLRFLTLAGNKISKIQGLTFLKKLGFLDLSENRIKKFDIDELPQTLVILNLKDNPCTTGPDYRGMIIQDLPNLRQLDGAEVTREERLEAGYKVSSDEESENESDGEEQPEEPLTDHIFRNQTNSILMRSQLRLESTVKPHNDKVLALDEIRIKQNLPPAPTSARSRPPTGRV